MKFTKTQELKASMIGSDLSLSVIGAFQIIEDAVTECMGELKIDGVTVKQKYDAFWVFVKTRVKFFERLLWGEEYTVTAFISFISQAKMHIDVKVSNQVSETVFYARVELCVLDIATQRIKKINSVGVDESMLTQEATMDISFGKFDIVGLNFIEQVKIRSTNIDHSHHTNNLEYLRFIMNTYSVEEMESKAIKEMEVVYTSQSYENDLIDILKTEFADRDLLILQKNDKPVIKCEIIFGK